MLDNLLKLAPPAELDESSLAALMVEHCRDSSLAVRKQTVVSLTELVRCHPSLSQVTTWVQGFFPLILHAEAKAAEKVLDCIWGLLFVQLVPSKCPAGAALLGPCPCSQSTSQLNQLPWAILGAVEKNRMTNYLDRACNTWAKEGRITKAVVTTLQSDISSPHDGPVWLLLGVISNHVHCRDVAQVLAYFKSCIVAPQEVGLYTLLQVLKVLLASVALLPSGDRASLQTLLLSLLSSWLVPCDLISAVMDVVVVVSSLETKGRGLGAYQSAVDGWAVPPLQDLDTSLPSVVLNSGGGGVEDEEVLGLRIFTLGQLATLCPHRTHSRLFLMMQSVVFRPNTAPGGGEQPVEAETLPSLLRSPSGWPRPAGGGLKGGAGEGRFAEEQHEEEVGELPAGWELKEEDDIKFLLSPPTDQEGNPVKRVKISTITMLKTRQRPSKTFPNGRFQELKPDHLSWVTRKRRVSSPPGTRQGSGEGPTAPAASKVGKVDPEGEVGGAGSGEGKEQVEVASQQRCGGASHEKSCASKHGIQVPLEEMELKIGSAGEYLKKRIYLAGRLNQFRRQLESNDPLHNRIKFEIASHMTDSANPLNINPAIKMNRDIYHDLLDYAVDHYTITLGWILGSLTDKGVPISVNDISRLGMLLNQIIVNTASKVLYCSAMLKVKTITSRDSGLTRAGLDNLGKVRVTQGHGAYSEMKNEHASLALQMYKKYGSLSSSSQGLDNVMINKKHYTQGYTVFEMDSRFNELDATNEKTLEERLAMFNINSINMEHERNVELKQSLDELVYNVVGRIIGSSNEDFKWFLDHFHAMHDHPNSDTAGHISHTMKNPTIPLNEAENNHMVRILEEMQTMFLETVASRAEDRDYCRASIQTMRSKTATKLERKDAEQRVMREVKRGGELILHGDLATIESIRKALNLRRTAETLFEKLAFIKIARSGTMHLVMNMTIQDFKRRMQVERSATDKMSLANIRLVVGVSITSDEDQIRKDFEVHRQVLEAFTKHSIMSAFKEHKASIEQPEMKNKLAAETIIQEFLERCRLRYYAKMPSEDNGEMPPPPTPFYDDMEENVVDLASSGLMAMLVRKAEKTADGRGLRAVKLALIPYFLNKKNIQDSKYALYLLEEHVDFEGLSDRDKARVDQYCSINLTGDHQLLLQNYLRLVICKLMVK